LIAANAQEAAPRIEVQGGTEMGDRGNGRRALQRVIAALAIGDIAYRLLAREPLRRALGIETGNA
jgi:hypothetical protein